MIVTTAGKATSKIVSIAKKLATKYELPFQERNGVSIEALKEHFQDDLVVVGSERLFIAPLNSKENLLFHPNLAMVRAKRIFNGEMDPFISACGIVEGTTFLDCTLGLAADSIIASLIAGEKGTVIGLEGNPLLYLLVAEGLAAFSSGNPLFDEAMKRIQPILTDHYSFLEKTASKSYDVVYFDPMFQSTIQESKGLQPLRGQAMTTELTADVIAEAVRVAKKRVVLKDHWQSKRFQRLGFQPLKRKTSLFHYGVIEITNETDFTVP